MCPLDANQPPDSSLQARGATNLASLASRIRKNQVGNSVQVFADVPPLRSRRRRHRMFRSPRKGGHPLGGSVCGDNLADLIVHHYLRVARTSLSRIALHSGASGTSSIRIAERPFRSNSRSRA